MTILHADDRLQRSERGVPTDGRRSDSFSKTTLGDQQHLEHADVTTIRGQDHGEKDKAAPAVNLEGEAALRAPEWIRRLSVEERTTVEGRLRRKLDIRLMPMIVLMYIMNYLDRVSGVGESVSQLKLIQTRTTLPQQNCKASWKILS